MKQANLQFIGASTLALAVLSFAMSSPAFAESANGTLQVQAGLVAAVSLSCEKPLTFGVLRIQSANLGVSETKWRLTPNIPDALPAFNQIAGAFGTATSVLPGPGQGECTLVGSLASDDTTITISVESSTGLAGASVLQLGAATPPAEGLIVDNFQTNPVSPKINDSSTRFAIGADLAIPNNLSEANFGGYRGSITVTVTEEGV